MRIKSPFVPAVRSLSSEAGGVVILPDDAAQNNLRAIRCHRGWA